MIARAIAANLPVATGGLGSRPAHEGPSVGQQSAQTRPFVMTKLPPRSGRSRTALSYQCRVGRILVADSS